MTENQVGHLEALFTIDLGPLDRGLRKARQKLASFDDNTSVGLTTDIKPFERGVDRARKQLANLSGEEGEVGIDANLSPLQRGVSKARRMLDKLNGENATVTANTQGFDQAREQTGSLRRDMTKLNGTTARMQATVDGVRGVLHRLSRVDEHMDNLQGRTARMGVAVAGGAAAGLVLSKVAGKFDLLSQTMTALGKVKMPLIYTAMGGLPGVIAPVAAATIGLAGALTQGAAGFVAIGGAAAGGAVAGLMAYTAAAKSAVSGAMLVREETRKAANEQLKQQRVAILNTTATRKFNLQLDKTAIALTKVQAELGNRMLPAFTRMTDLFTSKLPALTPPLYRLVDGVTAVAESFVQAVLKGKGLSQLQNVLKFIATSGITAAKALSNMGRAVLAGIQPVLPMATRLLGKIQGLTKSALGFTQSAKGMSTITSVMKILETRMYQVLGVIGNLSKGLFNLGAAFAPLGTMMLTGLTKLTAKFAELTSKGSGFREEVANLNSAGIPILRSMGGVVGELFSQFNRVSTAAMNLRMEGEKTRVLVAIFDSLKEAIGPVADGLIRSFKNLGPLLPPLITQFSKLFNNFAGQAPIVGKYVEGLTGLMGIFNSAPASVQSAVVQIAAFNAVVGTTGMSITGAAGGLATMVFRFSSLRAIQGKATASTLLWNASARVSKGVMKLLRIETYKSAAAWVRAKVTMVAHKVALVASAAATKAMTVAQKALNKSTYAGAAAWVRAKVALVAHKVAMVASTVATKTMTVAQRALNLAMRMNPIGLVVTAVALLAAGFVMLYRRSETFRNVINKIGNFLKTVAIGAFKGLVAGVKAAWQWFKKLPGPVQALISPLGFVIANFGKLKKVALATVKAVWNALKAAWNWISTNTPKVWNGVKSVVVSVGETIGRAAKAVWNAIKAAWNGIKGVTTKVWNGIKTFFSAFWDRQKRGWSRILNALKNVVQSAWSGIKSVTSRVWNGIQAFFSAFWDRQKRGWSRILSGLKNAVSTAWNGIKGVTTKVWNGIKTFFTKWWSGVKTFVIKTAKSLGRLIADRWKSMKAFATKVWNAYKDFMTGLWTRLKDKVVSTAKSLGRLIATRWKKMKAFAEKTWDQLKASVVNRVQNLKDRVVTTARNLGRAIADRWRGMKSFAETMWNRIRDGVVDRTRTMKERVITTARNLGKAVANRWKGMRDTAGRIFKSLGNRIINGLEKGVNGAIRLVNKLTSAIKTVAKALGLGGIAKKLPKIKEISIPRFAKGGITSGTSIAGEAGPESVVPHTRWTPEGQRAYDAVPAEYQRRSKGLPRPDARKGGSGAGGHRRGATWDGGGATPRGEMKRSAGYAVGMGPTTHNHSSFTKSMINKVMGKFPGISENTYIDHLGGERNSVDFWGPGGRGDPIGRGRNASIANYVTSDLTKGLDYIISNGRINSGGGWKPHNGPYAHFDHDHVTWRSGLDAVFSGAGKAAGGAYSGVKDALGNAYNSARDFLAKMWNPPEVPGFGGVGVAGEMISGSLKKLVSGATGWVKNKAKEMLSFGSGGGGAPAPEGQVKDWIKSGFGMGGAFPASPGNVNAMYGRVMQESGGNPKAVNNWDCLYTSAMILTRRGWLSHDEVEVGDETIGYDFETGQSKWTKITRVVHFEDAEVVRIGHSRWATTTTRNHRWVADKRVSRLEYDPVCPECGKEYDVTRGNGLLVHMAKAHGKQPEIKTYAGREEQFIETGDLTHNDRLRLAAPADTGDENAPNITVDEAAILAWIAGDGHVEKKNGGVTIGQTKPEKRDQIRALLERGGVPYSEYKSKPNRVGNVCHTFRMPAAYRRGLFSRAPDAIEEPEAFVASLSPQQRRAWLDAMIDAEGTRWTHVEGNKADVRIYQNDGPVQDAIKLAVYLEGYRPSARHLPGKEQWASCASISPCEPHVTAGALTIEDAGTEDVWCVTTELGSWTAGDDGHVFLTGNSNAKKGTPSKGLVQIIEPTWNANTTDKIGQFDSNWSDPVKSVAVSSRYMKNRYGRVVGSNGRGYSAGGVIPGKGPKSIMAHGGERVLPENLNTGFESLARSIDSWSARGNAAPGVEVGTSAIEKRLERLEDINRQLLERLEGGIDTYERNWSEGKNAMLASQASEGGRTIQDWQLKRNMEVEMGMEADST